MADGSVMTDAQMKAMNGSSSMAGMSHHSRRSAPSKSAAMICSKETRAAVVRTFGLKTTPASLHSWGGQTFRCSYQLPGGDLNLSVKDLAAAKPGRAYFDALRSRLPGARPIVGMENFGFPAFETPGGNVGFIKDHKTLWVDASRIPVRDLPAGFSRTEVAYGVAAAVIACWSE